MNALLKPSSNFAAVRDGRFRGVDYFDVDLSTARIAGNSATPALVLPCAGNSFYVDADPNNGYAVFHFQDTNLDRAPAPLFCASGSIFNLPFTQLLIENVAQAGKKLRFFYGTDVDFVAGGLSQIFATVSPLKISPAQSTVAVGTSSGLFLAANASRNYLLIQNNSPTDIWLHLNGGTPVVGQGVLVAAGGSAEWFNVIPTAAINAIASAAIAANLITIVQG